MSLFAALQHGLPSAAELAQTADVNARMSTGQTPLMCAVRTHTFGIEFYALLIAHRADVNAHDFQSNCALRELLLCDYLGYAELKLRLKFLLEARARPDAPPESVLYWAMCSGQNRDIVHLLASACDSSIMHELPRARDPELFAEPAGLARLLVESRSPLDFPARDTRNTPLTWALTHSLELLEAMLSARADVNRFEDGRTVLWHAVQMQHGPLWISTLLRDLLPDFVDTAPPGLPTPLTVIVQRNNVHRMRLVQVLLAHRASPNATNGRCSPLAMAAFSHDGVESPDVLALLLRGRADPNQPSKPPLLAAQPHYVRALPSVTPLLLAVLRTSETEHEATRPSLTSRLLRARCQLDVQHSGLTALDHLLTAPAIGRARSDATRAARSSIACRVCVQLLAAGASSSVALPPLAAADSGTDKARRVALKFHDRISARVLHRATQPDQPYWTLIARYLH